MRDTLREGAPLAGVLLSLTNERTQLIEDLRGVCESCTDLLEREPTRLQRFEEHVRRWLGLPLARMAEADRREMLSRLQSVADRLATKGTAITATVEAIAPHVAWERIRVASETVRSLQ